MNLLKRVLVALIFIPLLLYIFNAGGILLISLLAIIATMMNYEFIKMLKISKLNLIFPPAIVFSIAYNRYDYLIFTLFLSAILSMGKDVFANKLSGSIKRVSLAIFGLVYSSVFIALLYNIRLMQKGNYLVILLIVLIWITDTFAYFTGMLLGKHRNIVSASPNKSLEGFIGGFLFSFAASIGAYFILPIEMKQAIFAAISAGIFGQFGDLLESMIKRDAGVKDSSHIIPGHGGILDRFDSLIIAAPVFYFLMRFF